jgi:hypothetical protein
MGAFRSRPSPQTNPFWSSQELFQAHFDSLKLPPSITIQFRQELPTVKDEEKAIQVFLDPDELKRVHHQYRISIKTPIKAYLVCGVRGLLLTGSRNLSRLDCLELVHHQDLQCEICYEDNKLNRYWSCKTCSKTICFGCQDKLIALNHHECCSFCRQKH